MVPGSIDDLLLRVATELDDPDLTSAADGRITRTRAIRALDAASRQEFLRLRGDSGAMLPFKQEVILTVDSSDSDRYALPPRSREVIGLFEGSSAVTPLGTYSTSVSGFVVEEGCRAIRKRNYDPSSTISAWVIQEPCSLSMAKASGAAATSITFPSTATIGTVQEVDDYYNGARVCTILDGEIRTITDYVGTTRVSTVATWGSTPTNASTYTVMFDLPEIMISPVVLRAALILSRVDKVVHDSVPQMEKMYMAAHRDARVVLDKSNRGLMKGLRTWLSSKGRVVG